MNDPKKTLNIVILLNNPGDFEKMLKPVAEPMERKYNWRFIKNYADGFYYAPGYCIRPAVTLKDVKELRNYQLVKTENYHKNVLATDIIHHWEATIEKCGNCGERWHPHFDVCKYCLKDKKV